MGVVRETGCRGAHRVKEVRQGARVMGDTASARPHAECVTWQCMHKSAQ